MFEVAFLAKNFFAKIKKNVLKIFPQKLVFTKVNFLNKVHKSFEQFNNKYLDNKNHSSIWRKLIYWRRQK